MLAWSTQIPVLPSTSIDQLIDLSKKWLLGSTRTVWLAEDIGNDEPEQVVSFGKAGQLVSFSRHSTSTDNYGGFRHRWQDVQRREWTTDICGWRTTQKFLVGVQLQCQSLDLGARLPLPKKPYIVKQILEELGGDIDGSLPVSAEPYVLSESDVEFAGRILKGETENFLPVIYVSSTWRNEPALDVTKLAHWSAGMAHVVVEPSRRFSFIVANKVANSNPYDGAVSVCWPHGTGRQTKFLVIIPSRQVGVLEAISAA